VETSVARRTRTSTSSSGSSREPAASSSAGTRDEAEETHDVEGDWAVIVPAGVWHNVVNTGDGDLKLYSLYAPPEHPDGTVHRTKADAADQG
jgi:oxalate decarboxylase/phosphoglucose isomerase-like protein (cupin superfamily)